MWRRIYLGLILVRIYFALSPSYLHPDEHFQGPEVVAGHVFGFPATLTWEFSSATPLRSVFPLWLIYGWPLIVIRWVWDGMGMGSISPAAVYYALRLVMFGLSFVLEDWAMHELLPMPRQRRVGILLVASSYVTWTWQSHTFSNSIETILVLWALVLIHRIQEDRGSSQLLYSGLVGFLAVLGTFNRITFPAFLVIPLLQLLPHFRIRPWCLLVMIASGLASLAFAIILDTVWYHSGNVSFDTFYNDLVITPLNNLSYNLKSTNLAQHGLHPLYQHVLVNLPQLLGPALPLVVMRPLRTSMLYSALSAVAILSCFRHQEARFLVPTVPLLLSSISLPASKGRKYFWGVWIVFNAVLGILMGVYHQGGVVPAQLWLAKQEAGTQVFWWKTLSPPTYVLGSAGTAIKTHDLMGRPGQNMSDFIAAHVDCDSTTDSLLVAPSSATFLHQYLLEDKYQDWKAMPFTLTKKWAYQNHLNLDDLDFGSDGLWPTLTRVVGRRGLGVWKVHKIC